MGFNHRLLKFISTRLFFAMSVLAATVWLALVGKLQPEGVVTIMSLDIAAYLAVTKGIEHFWEGKNGIQGKLAGMLKKLGVEMPNKQPTD